LGAVALVATFVVVPLGAVALVATFVVVLLGVVALVTTVVLVPLGVVAFVATVVLVPLGVVAVPMVGAALVAAVDVAFVSTDDDVGTTIVTEILVQVVGPIKVVVEVSPEGSPLLQPPDDVPTLVLVHVPHSTCAGSVENVGNVIQSTSTTVMVVARPPPPFARGCVVVAGRADSEAGNPAAVFSAGLDREAAELAVALLGVVVRIGLGGGSKPTHPGGTCASTGLTPVIQG
jgi:hypothetical protein